MTTTAARPEFEGRVAIGATSRWFCLVVLLGGFLSTGLVGMVLNRTVRPG